MNNLKTPIIYLNSQDTLKKWKEDYKKYGDIAKALSK